MKFIKNIFITLIIIIISALSYTTIQIYLKKSSNPDNVEIQSWKSFTQSVKKAFTIKRGANGSMCTSNSDCHSGNCATGLCQNKFVVGGPCNNDGQCKSGICYAGKCNSGKCAGIGMACKHDTTCCSKRCIAGTCRRAHCKYGESSPGVCKLSPADTQTIITASVTVLIIATIVATGGSATPMLPIVTTMIGGTGSIIGQQTGAELAKQNAKREAENAKRKQKLAETQREAELVKLQAEEGITSINQALLEAEETQEKEQLMQERKQLAQQQKELADAIKALQIRMDTFDAVTDAYRMTEKNSEQ